MFSQVRSEKSQQRAVENRYRSSLWLNIHTTKPSSNYGNICQLLIGIDMPILVLVIHRRVGALFTIICMNVWVCKTDVRHSHRRTWRCASQLPRKAKIRVRRTATGEPRNGRDHFTEFIRPSSSPYYKRSLNFSSLSHLTFKDLRK